ncbi:hypothetical protein E3P94_00504 [Wallemia ichthyophaga]|nr:hypothetical protein E3P95_02122 [Wallemia ichthyophaga]TIB04524.1 hypothetical protein E3P94_00504 [Wallemia ichthyophaga]
MSLPVRPNVLDHLVFLCADLNAVAANFTAAGFTVQNGGTHADGRTENMLLVLRDGVYIELIAFVDSSKKHSHFWADKLPGWIDWACLGVKRGETGIEEFYDEPIDGGRLLADGTRIQWSVSFPHKHYPRGSIPFYCGDKTPRKLRVPDSLEHTNGVQGVKALTLLCNDTALQASVFLYSSILRQLPQVQSEKHAIFQLESPLHKSIELLLRTPQNSDEEKKVMVNNGDIIHQVELYGDAVIIYLSIADETTQVDLSAKPHVSSVFILSNDL